MTREDQFILVYKEKWNQLETYIDRIGKKGFGKLSNNELKAYLDLTKSVSHHLAMAKSNGYNQKLIGYLNDLVVRANNNLYIVRSSSFREMLNYVTFGFAKRVRMHKKEMLLSLIIFMSAMVLGMVMTTIDKDYGVLFLPEYLVERTNWEMEEAAWEEEEFMLLSSIVTVNNIGVAIKVFAFGIIGGVVSAYILFVNGAMLGALTSLVYVNGGNLVNYLALILPHGIVEIWAIIISGGAGIMIGKGLLLPGEYKRIDSVIKAAKEAAILIPGIVIMLIIAGLIEGFITPFRINAIFKLGFAGATLIGLVLYFFRKSK